MIPRLTLGARLNSQHQTFLKELARTSFAGDISDTLATRLTLATDNSIYQVLPQAAVFPRTTDDVVMLMQLANEPRYKSISFTARGGGTGTNGQSLSSGIIIDCSRYMCEILGLNLKENWVRVQPGVILDQLNNYLKPHGVFFAPSLAPANRATLGGMINTDACGKGSRLYGRTSEHLQQLQWVLADGTAYTTSSVDMAELPKHKKRNNRLAQIYRLVDEIVTNNQARIKQRMPKLSRFFTGYNLAKVYSDSRDKFNLNYILSGSEGTLAVVTEACLGLNPLPKHKCLVLIKYSCFDHALHAAESLLEHEPAAIETIDETILKLAKSDVVYQNVEQYFESKGMPPVAAVNLVEFGAQTQELLNEKLARICQVLDRDSGNASAATDYLLARETHEMDALWALRKKGVGLLGAMPGVRKPVPFIEDTAVPPQHLAAYINELRTLLKSYGLAYGMYGHIDVGCLHVRPAMDLKSPQDEALIREISDKVVALLHKYGGVMWAEHGKGFRSEYTPAFIGNELYAEMRRIKQVFDPDNRLNPGKIVTPINSPDTVSPLESPMRGQLDRQIDSLFSHEYTPALNCNGNGECFNFDENGIMCPSYKLTRNRIHSPKGRAGLLREWLRQLSILQQRPIAPADHSPGVVGIVHDYSAGSSLTSNFKVLLLPWRIIRKLANRVGFWRSTPDYSHAVYNSLQECLSCKACVSQCPLNVDIPYLKSKFLALYHTRYLRPMRDYIIAYQEWIVPWLAFSPKLYNRIIQFGLSKFALAKLVGLVSVPRMSAPSAEDDFRQRKPEYSHSANLSSLSELQKSRSVILLQDVFTSYYETQLVMDIYDLLSRLGITVYVEPYFASGKGLHMKGFQRQFGRCVRNNVQHLNALAQSGIAMVGIEPSIVLTYRDEYLQVLPENQFKYSVALIQEWLVDNLSQIQNTEHWARCVPQTGPNEKYYLLAHCSEKSLARQAQMQWCEVFKAFGLDLQALSAGCCGMAGAYGHETEHSEKSKAIFSLSWSHYFTNKQFNSSNIVVDGYSCRYQIRRIRNSNIRHPLQVLTSRLLSPH